MSYGCYGNSGMGDLSRLLGRNNYGFNSGFGNSGFGNSGFGSYGSGNLGGYDRGFERGFNRGYDRGFNFGDRAYDRWVDDQRDSARGTGQLLGGGGGAAFGYLLGGAIDPHSDVMPLVGAAGLGLLGAIVGGDLAEDRFNSRF